MHSMCDFNMTMISNFYVSIWLDHGSPDIWLNIISGYVREGISEMRLTFESSKLCEKITIPNIHWGYPLASSNPIKAWI